VGAIVALAAERSEKALLAAAQNEPTAGERSSRKHPSNPGAFAFRCWGGLARPDSEFASREDGLRVMLSERAARFTLAKSSARPARHQELPLAVGPEVRLDRRRVRRAAKSSGFMEGSLGRLILRARTAVIAALAS